MKEYICVESPNEVEGGMLVREQELIRCKDCKYRITANCERFGIKRYTQSDSFCSWAEPKEKKE
jgi:DNA-directed RNA polymerase subunit RPC12/RpoP